MKSAYLISPGLQMPGESFLWRGPQKIISHPMLWETMKGMSTGLVFRVRTEQNVGDTLNAEDRIESAVGLLDSTTRWRACLGIIRTVLTGMRMPDVTEACWNVFGMMTTKHPATVLMSERQQLAAMLRVAMDKIGDDPARGGFEASCAAMCIRLAFAENDVEVAHIVPYSPIYMVNGTAHQEDREATIEVLASGVFLSEAFARLCEKAPEWLFSKLPSTPEAPTTQPSPVKAQAEGSEGDDA